MPLTNSDKTALRERWKEVQASMAIEGIHYTDEEKALFEFMIEQGMSEQESSQYLEDYFDGKVQPPKPQAAE